MIRLPFPPLAWTPEYQDECDRIIGAAELPGRPTQGAKLQISMTAYPPRGVRIAVPEFIHRMNPALRSICRCVSASIYTETIIMVEIAFSGETAWVDTSVLWGDTLSILPIRGQIS
jgi:hypothetical protein